MDGETDGGSATSPEGAFGRVLRRLRMQRRLTQEELAEASGFHRSYVSFLERGMKSPTLHTIFELAPALGVRPTRIVEEVEKELGRPPAE